MEGDILLTKREAAEKWVGEFNAIPQGMIEALWTHAGEYEGAGWQEVTTPRIGDHVFHYPSQRSGEIVGTTAERKQYMLDLDGETVFSSPDDLTVERHDVLPMWGTMWSFGDRCDEYWLEGEDGIQIMSDHGFRVYEHEEFGYFFGIDGAGYNFYEHHWMPLYEARGLQWHEKEVENMTVLIIEPGKAPREAEVGNGLESLQKTVGGDIQAVYPYDEQVALICHEEGKILGLPLNRALYDEQGRMFDIVAGTFIVCGLSEGNFASLSPEDMAKFKEQFHHPEAFAKVNGQIVATKVEPPKVPLREALDQNAQRSKAEFGGQPTDPDKARNAER